MSIRDGDHDPQTTKLLVQGMRVDLIWQAAGTVRQAPDLRVWKLKGRDVYAEGRAVFTHQAVGKGDELWVLFGAKKPVLLRPRGAHLYSFLGECVVVSGNMTTGEVIFADVMFGAAVREAESFAYDHFKNIRIA